MLFIILLELSFSLLDMNGIIVQKKRVHEVDNRCRHHRRQRRPRFRDLITLSYFFLHLVTDLSEK